MQLIPGRDPPQTAPRQERYAQWPWIGRGWRQRLARAFAPIPVGPEERARLATNVRAATVAALAGSGLAVLSNLLAGSWRSAAILAAFLVLVPRLPVDGAAWPRARRCDHAACWE